MFEWWKRLWRFEIMHTVLHCFN